MRLDMYVHDPLVELPRPSAEDPPLEFLRSGAENPPSDLSRPGAEQIFLLYIEEKFSALGRGESTFGSIAPGCGTDFSSLYRGEIFCARARRIHLWIYLARARTPIFLLYIAEKIFCARARRIHLWITALGRGTDFHLYIEEKFFCARARRIHHWIYRARARNGFPSLYRGENFLRSGAENPPLDLSRPGAEWIFLLYMEEKFSALGRGESTFGSIAPGGGTDFSPLYRGEIFCARARRIHLWIYRARARILNQRPHIIGL